MLTNVTCNIPGNTASNAIIWPSWKSDMNCDGCQCGFHSIICRRPASMDWLRSSDSRNVAALTYPTLVKTHRKNNGMSYTVVLYVASIRHISEPYVDKMFCCHLLWCANMTGDWSFSRLLDTQTRQLLVTTIVHGACKYSCFSTSPV